MTGESAYAYGQFQRFLAMPQPRSVTQLSRQLGLASHSSLSRAASQYHWITRASAYDQHLARQAEERAIDAVSATQRDALAAASMAAVIGARELERELHRIEAGGTSGMSVPETMGMLRRAVEIARLIGGESTSNLAFRGTLQTRPAPAPTEYDFSRLTPEEALDLALLLQKATP